MRAWSLERNIDPFAGRIGRRRRADRAGRHDLRREAAANAAEAVAIKEKGPGILAEREDQRLRGASRRYIKRERVGAAKIGVARIERAPVGRSEEVFRPVAAAKVRGETKDRLAVAPGRDIDRIAGGDE